MTETLLFVLGMALYYLIVSPRFRKYLGKCVRSWMGRPLEDAPVVAAALPAAAPAIPPVTKAAAKPAKRYADMNSSGKMVVDEETFQEWLDNIQKANGGGDARN